MSRKVLSTATLDKPATPERIPSSRTPWQVRMQRAFNELTEAERRAGAYFAENPNSAYLSITEVVEVSGIGYGSIMRFCKKIGCRGYQEFKVLMARDIAADRSASDDAESLPAAKRIGQWLTASVERTIDCLDWDEVKRAATVISEAKRVLCIGVASSFPVALSLDWKLKRLGIPSWSLSDAYVMSVDAARLDEDSVLFAVSASGATKDIVTAAQLAKDSGATVVCLTNYTKTPLVDVASIRLITSAERDPISEEIPSLVAPEAALELVIQRIREIKPEVDDNILQTFDAIADRKV